MNRFFTLLFAASCLTAFGQGDCIFSEEDLWGLSIGGGSFECLGYGGLGSSAYEVQLFPNGVIVQTAGDYSCEVGVWEFLPFTCSYSISGVNVFAECYEFLQCVLESGCLDEEACNYDPEAEFPDASCLYLDDCGDCGGQSQSGCTDANACNYDPMANCDDESCDYSCCPGPGCCGTGTTWNWQTSECDVSNPADINLDGCVQLNDLLDLLTAYGDCAAEESPWQCGDPLEYQGYDYETVQIGEQCWIAENLRAENYRNGDAILGFADREWSTTTEGGVFVYGEGNGNCNNYSPDGDACDESWALDQYGRLYNWYAVDDARSLCPIGWHIPSDAEWTVLNDYLGGDNPVNPYSWGNAGAQMKTDYGWAEEFNGVVSGTNSSGFSGLPGGSFWPTLEANNFSSAGYYGTWWSSSPTGTSGSLALTRSLTYSFNVVNESSSNKRAGYSVRCVQDAE